jgi:hypothetical protein
MNPRAYHRLSCQNSASAHQRTFWGLTSGALKVCEQEVDGLPDQFCPAGMLRIRQLIQHSQLALPYMYTYRHQWIRFPPLFPRASPARHMRRRHSMSLLAAMGRPPIDRRSPPHRADLGELTSSLGATVCEPLLGYFEV